MTDNNRGAYTPQSDAPLAFDARRMGGSAGRPVPITLIVSLVILAVLVVGALVLYKNGPRSADQPPVPVGDPVGNVRGPAEGQPTEPPGLQVYEAAEPAGGAPVFTPPPEQPVRPAPVASAPLPPPPAATNTAAALPAAPLPPIGAAPVAKLAPPPAAATPKTAAVAPAPAAAGAVRVQIGAFSTTALADAGWTKVARLLPGEMVGKTKVVEKVERDGQTLYRALVGGFGSRAEADRLCAALKAKGEACAVRN